MTSWIKDAIFYQIYPASFYDGNGDGTGDLKGITQKLDYIADLGVNAIWLNPFYKSPFKDGGYDIENYRSVDERFGTVRDFENLVSECKKRNIRIIIDLVIGHTSTEHEWFKKSAKDETNKYSDYYIWTDSIFSKYRDKTIHGLYPRDGGYYVNYYACQPALNFGFNKIEAGGTADNYDNGNGWMMHYTDERLKPLREEVLDIMRFWLDKGVDGFRVDMANSLVKGCVFDSDKDEDIEGNRWLWNILISTIKKEYGEDTAFISEWVNPENAVSKCGFDVDFFAHDIPCYNELFRNEPHTNLLPSFEKGYSFFGKDGKGSIENFINYSLKLNEVLKGKGYYSVPSGSHDQVRLAERKGNDLMKCVFAFLLTYSQVPFIYYGDELGIKHNFSLNKDGGYIRTGARTPMLWNEGKNKGFSLSDEPYLPADTETDSVEKQQRDENSLLNAVKKLISIRKEYECLSADGDLEIIKFCNNLL
ncbi:MAG: hypothetical protein IJU84_01210, partial [Clostridia bacterium]|nr:hypothetical protein [Clostridia bacterium]